MLPSAALVSESVSSSSPARARMPSAFRPARQIATCMADRHDTRTAFRRARAISGIVQDQQTAASQISRRIGLAVRASGERWRHSFTLLRPTRDRPARRLLPTSHANPNRGPSAPPTGFDCPPFPSPKTRPDASLINTSVLDFAAIDTKKVSPIRCRVL